MAFPGMGTPPGGSDLYGEKRTFSGGTNLVSYCFCPVSNTYFVYPPILICFLFLLAYKIMFLCCEFLELCHMYMYINIFFYSKLWVLLARHNFWWVKNESFNPEIEGFIALINNR